MMPGMVRTPRKKTLYDAYRFPGFTPGREVKGRFGDRTALVIPLTRRSKKRPAGRAAWFGTAGTIAAPDTSAISPAATGVCTSRWTSVASTAGGAAA
jgi:hypothetical protein